MKFSNLTNKEYFTLHGELSVERQEDLVYAEDYMSDWSDELSGIHGEITALKNKLRGPNKEALIKILSDLEEFQHTMSNSYDFMCAEGRL